MEKYEQYLIDWIRYQVRDAKMLGVIVGVSGGIDSAIVAHLSKKAFPDNSLALWMDIESSTKSKEMAILLKNKIKIKMHELNLEEIYKPFKKMIKNNLFNEQEIYYLIFS